MTDTKPLQRRVRAAIADAIDHARQTCMDLDERDAAQAVDLIASAAMAEVLRQTGHREARLGSPPVTPAHRVLLARLADERATAVRNAPLCRTDEVRWVNEGMAGGLRIAEAHVVAMFEGSAAVAEYMRGQAPGRADDGSPREDIVAQQPEATRSRQLQQILNLRETVLQRDAAIARVRDWLSEWGPRLPDGACSALDRAIDGEPK